MRSDPVCAPWALTETPRSRRMWPRNTSPPGSNRASACVSSVLCQRAAESPRPGILGGAVCGGLASADAPVSEGLASIGGDCCPSPWSPNTQNHLGGHPHSRPQGRNLWDWLQGWELRKVYINILIHFFFLFGGEG